MRMTTLMRRLSPVIGLVAGLAAWGTAMAKVEVQEIPGGTDLSFTVDRVDFTAVEMNGTAYNQASLVGVDGYTGVAYRVGAPAVPVIRFFVRGDVEVRAAGRGPTTAMQAGRLLAPSQPSRLKTPDARAAFAFDAKAYEQSDLRGPAYTVEPAGSVRGVPQSLVTLYPVAYAGRSNQWALTSRFDVTVRHADRGDATGPSRDIFAFVVGERFKSSAALARYAQFKEDQGYLVETLVVAPGETPDSIRARIKAQYARTDARLRHVLIIGENEDVPGLPSTIISGVTDHYYRAIDTDDYATDINGPDIGVGRVSAQTEEHLAAVVDKFIRYVGGQFSRESWLNEVAWIATNDRWEVAEGTHNYVVDTYTTGLGYTGIFPAAAQAGGDKLYAITHSVPDTKVHEVMNLGRTIINYSGHGSTTSWAGPNVSQANVRAMSDRDALPFVISNACITGDFRVGESFGETWQRHPAGAIVFWGSMDSTYWDEDDILERRMFDGIFQGGMRQFATLTDHALSEVWKFYGGEAKSKYYWETYVIFGDPSLDLRTTRTRAATVSGPAELPVGSTEASYTVTDENGPVAGARVALSVPGGGFKLAGLTDADGKVTFDISTAARDVVTMTLSVSGGQTKATQGQLQIIPADFPYLSLSDWRVNARPAPDAYVGESAVLTFRVMNMGLKPTTGGKIEITGVEGPLQVLGAEVAVPPLTARDSWHANGDEIRVALTGAATPGATGRVNLRWTTHEGQTSTTTMTLKARRAGLTVAATDFGQPGDEGGINPGETGPVFVTVVNSGNETINATTLVAAPGACVSGVEGSLAVNNLAPGATVRLAEPLLVTIDSACRNGDMARFGVAGEYDSVAMRLPLSAETAFVAGTVSVRAVELGGLTLAIPDDGPEVAQDVEVGSNGVLTDVGVRVQITHPYIGDLTVKLVHPDGTVIALHEQAGGGADNLDQTWGLGGSPLPGLAALKGKAAQGTWKVLVQDHAGSDVGTLTLVSLTVKGYLSR